MIKLLIMCILLIVAIKMIDRHRRIKNEKNQYNIQKEAYKEAIKEIENEKQG